MPGRIAPLIIAFTALLAIPACSAGDPDRNDPPPDPLLYEIVNADGEVEGWMIGTIHALPDGVEWRTSAIDEVVDEADLLLVEVAELENSAALAMTFGELASTEGLGPLSQRVAPDLREPLAEIVALSDFPRNTFANTESWAAAIMLAQVDSPASPNNGVDRALIREFAGREVRGFETIAGQLGVFDELAEADQRDLLEGTVREWHAARAQPGKLMRAWRGGDLAALEKATTTGIMADPELREALLVGRNRDWTPQLLAALDEPEKPLVAVGTAHLVGPDGLAATLQTEGYSVQRIK